MVYGYWSIFRHTRRFLDRVSRIDQFLTDKEDVYEEHYAIYNDTVKKVSEDIDEFKFNTAIACLMTYVNEIYNDKKISRQELKTLLTFYYSIFYIFFYFLFLFYF